MVMLKAVFFGAHKSLLTHAVVPAGNVHTEAGTIFFSLGCKCWHCPSMVAEDPRLCCAAMLLLYPAYIGAEIMYLAFVLVTGSTDNKGVLICPSVHVSMRSTACGWLSPASAFTTGSQVSPPSEEFMLTTLSSSSSSSEHASYGSSSWTSDGAETKGNRLHLG